ncbi:MAG: 4Fe-4S ferredoxin, partial [Ignavibacteriaceae bacterium]|nr:4Fe-4S ferredoxin [Ignavibacteriaceae bacterium]
MEVIIENIATYLVVIAFIALLFYYYIKKHKKHSRDTKRKIVKARELGFNEPVSLHPV